MRVPYSNAKITQKLPPTVAQVVKEVGRDAKGQLIIRLHEGSNPRKLCQKPVLGSNC